MILTTHTRFRRDASDFYFYSNKDVEFEFNQTLYCRCRYDGRWLLIILHKIFFFMF